MGSRFSLMVLGMVISLLVTGCNAANSAAPDVPYSDPTEKLPARFKTQEAVPAPDFSEAAKADSFQQAIMEAAALLGSQPQPLRAEATNEEVPGGISFAVSEKKVQAIIRDVHAKFLEKGFYLFRYDQSFNINGRPDKVGLLPTTDKYAVMAAMSTNGNNYNIGTAGVIAWMKEMEQGDPFLLTGIGFDFMEGHFTGPVRDPARMAQRMYEFCPDIVDQGVGDIDKLAEEIRKGAIYFWWD